MPKQDGQTRLKLVIPELIYDINIIQSFSYILACTVYIVNVCNSQTKRTFSVMLYMGNFDIKRVIGRRKSKKERHCKIATRTA
jgi:hypothetical protein